MKKVQMFRPASKATPRAFVTADRRAAKAFYKLPQWRAVRAVKLSLSPLCADCQGRGRVEAATEVHHLIRREDRPDLALDLDNLGSLCKPCHSRRTAMGE